MRVPLVLVVALALLAGCDSEPTAVTPAPPSPSLTIPAEAFDTDTGPLQAGTAVDVAFISQLNSSGVPYTSSRTVITEAHVVCATMSANTGASRDQVADLERFGSHNRAFVDAAIAAYCPEFSYRP